MLNAIPERYARPVESPVGDPQNGIPKDKHFTGQACGRENGAHNAWGKCRELKIQGVKLKAFIPIFSGHGKER